VDAAGVDGRDPLEDYHQINAELRQYQPELAVRPQIVVLNKIDLPEAQANLERLRRELPAPQDKLFAIAAATREGIEPLLQRVAQILRDMPTLLREPVEPNEPPLTWPIPEVDPNIFVIEREDEGWRVHGRRIERLITMTNFAQPDSLDRIARVMAASGIASALMEMGVQEGDSVYIGKEELTWSDTDLYG
jgi:GTP-binding protein